MNDATEDSKESQTLVEPMPPVNPEELKVIYQNRHQRRRAAKLAKLQAKEEAQEKKAREGSNVR